MCHKSINIFSPSIRNNDIMRISVFFKWNYISFFLGKCVCFPEIATHACAVFFWGEMSIYDKPIILFCWFWSKHPPILIETGKHRPPGHEFSVSIHSCGRFFTCFWFFWSWKVFSNPTSMLSFKDMYSTLSHETDKTHGPCSKKSLPRISTEHHTYIHC